MAPSPELKASGETKTNAENNIDSGAREPANLQRTSNQQNVKVFLFLFFTLNFVLSPHPLIICKSK